MMTILDAHSIYALLIANTFLLGAATLAILRFQRLLKQSSKPGGCFAVSEPAAQPEQSLAENVTDERLSSLQDTFDKFEHINTGINSPFEKLPFETAVRMARAGASIDDLVRTCGFSHGEARLFLKVHSKSAA